MVPTSRALAVPVRVLLVIVCSVVIAGLLASLVIPAAYAGDRFIDVLRRDILSMPPIGEADPAPQNSFILASDGSFLAELSFAENRIPVTLDKVPKIVIDAVLATEDASFYSHEGVNHLAIVRASLANFRADSIESGASTITQQYVKMAYLSPEQTIARKVEEALLAIRLENVLTKDEILQRYLNRAYFGAGVYGIGTASQRYFSKDVTGLTLSEGALLAGLLRAPETNNPISNRENSLIRRNIVLRQMAAQGFLTQQQADVAIASQLGVKISEPAAPEYPFWSRWVSQLLVNETAAAQLGTQHSAMIAMGGSVEERHQKVFQSGLRIITTLDRELQEAAEETLFEALTTPDHTPADVAREPFGALISVEPGTGAIRAMALGPHEFGSCQYDDSWVEELPTGELLCDRTQVNPAVPGGGGSGRQPGSSFKPILDAAAIEAGVPVGWTFDARGPKQIDGCASPDGPYIVRNTGGDDILDMYEAVKRSSNVYHALLIAQIGPRAAADMMDRLSGYPVEQRDIVCSLALGANATTPLAMASAYATLANRGEACAPYPIERIENAQGEVLWEHAAQCRRVIDTDVADWVVDLLAGPVSPGGTAPSVNLGRWPTRGKTGSTNNNTDAWFVGFVRQLATAAWVGYPNTDRVFSSVQAAQAACGDAAIEKVCRRTAATSQRLVNVTIGGRSYRQVFGGSLPAPIWGTYMRRIVERYEPQG
ncbi:MAG: transglycosylase domain-containing protein, partial [Nitriliruptoraceae bacterium]